MSADFNYLTKKMLQKLILEHWETSHLFFFLLLVNSRQWNIIIRYGKIIVNHGVSNCIYICNIFKEIKIAKKVIFAKKMAI